MRYRDQVRFPVPMVGVEWNQGSLPSDSARGPTCLTNDSAVKAIPLSVGTWGLHLSLRDLTHLPIQTPDLLRNQQRN